jgi:hypothetical protein
LFLVQQIFTPECGGDIFLWNTGSCMDDMALYSRRWQLSELLLWKT